MGLSCGRPWANQFVARLRRVYNSTIIAIVPEMMSKPAKGQGPKLDDPSTWLDEEQLKVDNNVVSNCGIFLLSISSMIDVDTSTARVDPFGKACNNITNTFKCCIKR